LISQFIDVIVHAAGTFAYDGIFIVGLVVYFGIGSNVQEKSIFERVVGLTFGTVVERKCVRLLAEQLRTFGA
jgi:hypothetical protein